MYSPLVEIHEYVHWPFYQCVQLKYIFHIQYVDFFAAMRRISRISVENKQVDIFRSGLLYTEQCFWNVLQTIPIISQVSIQI